MLSTSNFDQDKLFGILWSAFVDRFYKGVGESINIEQFLKDWDDGTAGWVPAKTLAYYIIAVRSLAHNYYLNFRPDDGARTLEQSELRVEDDLFFGFLDGLSADGIIHEVKSTSRSPQLHDQLWKVQSSTQIKLYSVLTQATGVRVEFAWKDAPNVSYRSEVLSIGSEQRRMWEQSLRRLAQYILSLEDNVDNYPCHPDGCCLITKRYSSICPWQSLCDGVPNAEQFYKIRKEIR